METGELEDLIKDTLEGMNVEYNQVRVIHNELYIRCDSKSEAPIISTILRKLVDPDRLNRISIEYEDSGEINQYEDW